METTIQTLREDIGEIKAQLQEIQRSVNLVAVQDERMKHLEISIEALWKKQDRTADTIDMITRHQASCPREQIKWVWWVLVPQAFVLLGILASLLMMIIHK